MSAAEVVTAARRVVFHRAGVIAAHEKADRRFTRAARHLWDHMDGMTGDELEAARVDVWTACRDWGDARAEVLRWDELLAAAVDVLARLPRPEGVAA